MGRDAAAPVAPERAPRGVRRSGGHLFSSVM